MKLGVVMTTEQRANCNNGHSGTVRGSCQHLPQEISSYEEESMDSVMELHTTVTSDRSITLTCVDNTAECLGDALKLGIAR